MSSTQDTAVGDGCVVIDLKTRQPMAAARAKANHQPVKPRVDTGSSDYARDYHLRNEMFAEMLPILEGGVPKLSPGGSFRPDFERMLAACKRGLGDFSDVS